MLRSLMVLLALSWALPSLAAPHKFEISGNDFKLDGRKLLIVSGELHYARIPRAYWRDRMRKMRAMGLNSLTAYVFWNAHEAEQGQFNFSGELDVAEFVRTAQEEGLWVILRPGPYACAEWDLGGLPSWLLRDPNMQLRQNNPKFLAAATRYMNEVGKRLGPLMVDKGGPILMVQVENEYGSFGSDHAYMNAVRKMIHDAGFEGQLYTADGSSMERLKGGTFPDLPIAINFGNNEEPEKEFANLDAFRKGARLMCGEFWAGWFDTWGEKHNTTPVERAAGALDWMLSRGISVSLYMIHGGTNFGFNAGADFRKAYMPDTTSYDYDSPIDEAGRLTPKFTAMKNVIVRNLPAGTVVPEPPAPLTMIEIPAFELAESLPLSAVMGKPRHSAEPPAMESLGQPHGLLVYRHKSTSNFEGDLKINRVADYAIVSVDGKKTGTLERRFDQTTVSLTLKSGSVLEVLLDVMGHINFGRHMLTDRKGISGVSLGTEAVTGWDTYSIPLTTPPASGFKRETASGPAFYRAQVNLPATGDTYLDMSGWGKGYVWVNGHNLGRYWSTGPQQALFLPGPWLQAGANEIIVLDLEPGAKRSIRGVRDPVWLTPHPIQ